VQSNASLPDPENTSRRLLEKIGVDSIPIDVHGVEKIWKGLTIVEEEIDGPGYLLPLGKIGAEIIVRGADPIERKRFTIAHEVGHWVLGITCERKMGEFRQPPGVRRDVIEKWCDTFAASFLVPRHILIDYFRDVHEAVLIARLAASPKHFRVSEDAMFLRVYDVLGMRVAYVDTRSRAIVRAFVPDSAVPDLTRVLTMPEIIDCGHVDTLTLRLLVGTVRFQCSWRRAQNSAKTLFLLYPAP
jgi:hypothetical protein